MPKKSASQRRKEKKKKLQSEQASYKHQLEKLELKSEEPKKVIKEKSLEYIFLKDPYLEKVEQIKASVYTLVDLISVKLGNQVAFK